MKPPEPGDVWVRGNERRVVTEVSEGFVSAAVYGSRQRDRVICLKYQWERWARSARLLGPPGSQPPEPPEQLNLTRTLFDNGIGN